VQELAPLGATVGGALTPEMPGMPKTKYDGPLSKFAYDPRKYRRQMASGGLADTAVAQRMMRGGHLGSYSDGGRLLKGPGDGMSDDIPAKIGRKQPARLADGEFCSPSRCSLWYRQRINRCRSQTAVPDDGQSSFSTNRLKEAGP
jgi:hypothetical protein